MKLRYIQSFQLLPHDRRKALSSCWVLTLELAVRHVARVAPPQARPRKGPFSATAAALSSSRQSDRQK